ncbi:MAG: hypothetical protein Q7J98_12915 [Kiritimatiellia bacterium]|nr:hypothetical protein [Kiritimatiellia bacterium]
MHYAKLWCVILGLAILGGNLKSEETSKMQFSFTIRPDKETVMQGEPCIILLTFTNMTSTNITLEFGFDEVYSLIFSVIDEKGNSVLNHGRIEPILWRGSLGVKMPIIPPGSSATKKVVLNQWCPILLSKGTYTVVCLFKQPSSTISATAKCKLKIVPGDEYKLTKIFDDIANAIRPDSKYDEIDFSLTMLAYSRSPLAVRSLNKLIFTKGIFPRYTEEPRLTEAIRGLERIGTSAAAQELVNVVETEKTDPSFFSVRIRDEAALSLFRLKDMSRDPEIIRLCEKITSSRPRPVERVIRD